MSLPEILLLYVRAILAYWWLIVVGAVMPFADLFKWHHKHSKELVVPYWARMAITVVSLAVAQFLAFRDTQHNLSEITKEKSSLTSENTQLQSRVVDLEQEVKDLKERAPTQRLEAPRLQYMGSVTPVVADADGKFSLPNFDFRNIGSRQTSTPVALRLYFSETVVFLTGSLGQWEAQPGSKEPGMPTEFWIGAQYTISPGEPWHGPSFSGQKQGGVAHVIRAKLKVFYGGAGPTEVAFAVMPPNKP